MSTKVTRKGKKDCDNTLSTTSPSTTTTTTTITAHTDNLVPLNFKDFKADQLSSLDDNWVQNLKKNLEVPVSNDSLDFLETQMDILNDTTNLGEKVNMYSKLGDYTKKLENEVDMMIELMDTLDISTVCEDIKREKNNNDTSDVSDDIINLDKLLGELKNEDVMQIKILYMRKIIDQIEKCRSKCEKSKMTVTKCS